MDEIKTETFRIHPRELIQKLISLKANTSDEFN
jgi:hypothetical protein